MDTSTLAATILAVGGLLPVLIAVVQQPKWSAKTRSIMTVLVSGLAGLVTYVSTNGLNFGDVPTLVTTVVGIILASVASYESIWKKVGTTKAIELATSPSQTE